MKSNAYIKKLKAYPIASHKAWEFENKKEILKLDWNEADLELPEALKDAVKKFIDEGPLNWYPDIANKDLVAALSSYVDMPENYIQYFEGSDSALDYIVRTFTEAGDGVVLAAPTYDNFRVYVESLGGVPTQVIAKDIFSPDIVSLKAGISPMTKMVYIVNPNNPTGVLYSNSEIESLLTVFPEVLFLIDEAYAEFAGVTVMPLIKKYKNMIIARSFSKAFGLASFRVGYIVSDPENIAHVNKIRNGKNVSALAQIAALAALKHKTYMESYVREVNATKSFVCSELTRLGFQVKNTPANFVLLKTENPTELHRILAEQKVFMRTLYHLPAMDGYIRVTVGTKRSAEKFIAILKELMRHGLT